MKIALCALFLFFGFQFQTRADIKAKKFLTLSYSEFAALTRDDRAAYIEEMRLAALATEKEQGGTGIETASSVWISAFLQRALAASGDMCIYAGYVSRRDSSNHCVAPAGSSGSCGAGKTLCNPLLYGYGPGNGGICTSSRTTPTNDCENQYQKIPNYKAYQVADQVVGKNMREKFDAQAAELNTYCSGASAEAQKGLCDKLKSKTTYMKAKLEAAEKRKKANEDSQKPKAEPKAKAADAGDDKEKKEEAKKSDTTPAPVTPPPAQAKPTPSTSGPVADSKPNPETTTPKGADGAPQGAISPSGGAKTPAPKPTEPEKKEETKPVVKKNITPGKCITNKDDFEEKKASLPPDFQKFDTDPPMYSGTKSGSAMGGLYNYKVSSTMKIELTKSGKFKLTATVKTDTAVGSWVAEDDVVSICPSGDNQFIVKLAGRDKDGSERTTTVRTGSGRINASTKKGDMDYSKVSPADYRRTTAGLVGSGVPLWINGSDSGRTVQ